MDKYGTKIKDDRKMDGKVNTSVPLEQMETRLQL